MPEKNPNLPGAARQAQANHAAMQSVSSERLLDGEAKYIARAQEILSAHPPGYRNFNLLEDALHWKAVYGELLEFKRFMIDGARARLEKMSSSESRQEIENTDIAVALVESERFARRLAYWSSRVQEYS